MKINWNTPSVNPDLPLTEEDIKILEERIKKAADKTKGNHFYMFLFPKEISWSKQNIDNGCVKSYENEYPIVDGKILTFFGVDEQTCDYYFSKI